MDGDLRMRCKQNLNRKRQLSIVVSKARVPTPERTVGETKS